MSLPFPRVVGHEEARQGLAAAVRAGRAAGSLLLTGPEGVGRRTLAKELAKALGCQRLDEAGASFPCGACGHCGRVERGTSGDYVVVEPPGQSIGIEQVQGLLEELALAPVEARVRTFVIAPADVMTEDAQNALLKGLEEPPARALLVLVAGSEDDLLPTIVSRCRLVRLGPLPEPRVLEVLERAGLDPADARERARWAAGSPGRALSDEAQAVARLASDAVAAFAAGHAYSDPMGTVDRLAKLVDAGAAEAAARRTRIIALLAALGRALRDALVLRATSSGRDGAGVPRLSGAEGADVARLAADHGEGLERAIVHLARLEEEVDQSVNPTLVLEGLVLEVGGALRPRGARAALAGAITHAAGGPRG